MIFPGVYSADSAENKTFRPRRSSSRSRPKSSGIATSHPGIATSHPGLRAGIYRPILPTAIQCAPRPRHCEVSQETAAIQCAPRPRHCEVSSETAAIQCAPRPRHCEVSQETVAIQCTPHPLLRGFARNRGNPAHTAPASLRGFARNRGNPMRTSPASLRGFARNRGNPVHTSPENDCFARLTPYSQRQGGTHYIRKDKKTASQAENPYQEGAHRRAALRKAPPALHRVHGRVLFRLPSVAGPRPAIRAPPEDKKRPTGVAGGSSYTGIALGYEQRVMTRSRSAICVIVLTGHP